MSKSEGLTLVELLICIAMIGITVGIVSKIHQGDSLIPSKQSCLSQGGKWTEGMQYGRYTQLCTYN